MFKSLKQLAVPLEKTLNKELLEDLTLFGEFFNQEESAPYDLSVETLSTGRRVYCPKRQNPVRNRKRFVRSLLID